MAEVHAVHAACGMGGTEPCLRPQPAERRASVCSKPGLHEVTARHAVHADCDKQSERLTQTNGRQ